VILGHLGRSRQMALLAAGVLLGREKESALAHAVSCRRCRVELEELRALVSLVERDPLRDGEPSVPLAVLTRSVEREVERILVPGGRPRGWLVVVPAAAAVLVVGLLVPALIARFRPAPPAAATAPPPAVSTEALDRLERNLVREHAARYLTEAGDVLVAVAATSVDCDPPAGRVDLGPVPEQSRDLLARRALLVEADREAVASARAVLDDVERALREVAELPSCVRRRDLEHLRREVDRRQLLMRIRLMTRELEG